jgi:hypothetical protein
MLEPMDVDETCTSGLAYPSVHFDGCGVFIAVGIKHSICWNITTCSLLKVIRRFGGICDMFLQNEGELRGTGKVFRAICRELRSQLLEGWLVREV